LPWAYKLVHPTRPTEMCIPRFRASSALPTDCAIELNKPVYLKAHMQTPGFLRAFSGHPHSEYTASTVELGEPPATHTIVESARNVIGDSHRFKEQIPEGALLILRHIQDELCSGDVAASSYLLRWIAYGYARREKTHVLVVLLGTQGADKSAIFGHHAYRQGLIPKLYGNDFREVSGISPLIGRAAARHCGTFVTVNAGKKRRAGSTTLSDLCTSDSRRFVALRRAGIIRDHRNFVSIPNETIYQGDGKCAVIRASDRYTWLAVDNGKISADVRCAYIAALWAAVDDELSVQWIARFLRDVKFDGWHPRMIGTF
jgi:hypothetical protein